MAGPGDRHDWPEEARLVCRGKEFSGRGQMDKTWSAFHVPGLFLTGSPPTPPALRLQEYLDWVADPAHSYVADGTGGLSVVAHPFLSPDNVTKGTGPAHRNTARIAALRGLTAIEIAHHGACGMMDRLWDELLRDRCAKGLPLVWGFGADDSHQTVPGKFCLSWTATKVQRVNTWALKRGMRAGACYATNGLRGLDIRVDGDAITVTSEEPVEVRWLKAGQYYAEFGLERMTRHGFPLSEDVPLGRARTILRPSVDAAPGPNHCVRLDENVIESTYLLNAADGTRGQAAGYIRCMVLRGADLEAFGTAIEAGEVLRAGARPTARPMITKAFFMPIRIDDAGQLQSQYPDAGTWLTGPTHNHADLYANQLDQAGSYYAAYEEAGHRAAFETGYTMTCYPYLYEPAGATPAIRDVTPVSCVAGQDCELAIAGSDFGTTPFVTVGGEEARVMAASGSRIRARVPNGVAPGVYDVTVRDLETPYQDTLDRGCAVQTVEADNQGWCRFGFADGLPDLDVYCVRHAVGHVWAGTKNGIAHLADERWVTDRTGPICGEAMAEDKAGNLWVAGYQGLYRRGKDGAWQRYTKADGMRTDVRFNDVFCTGDERVVVSCYSPSYVGIYQDGAWTSETEGVPQGWSGITTFLETPDGQLWGASFRGPGVRRTTQGWEVLDLPDLPAEHRRIYRSPRGRTVIATAAKPEEPTGGVCVLDENHWRIFNQEQGLPHHRVWELAFEPDDTIWAATSHGLARIGPDGEVRVFTPVNSGLPSNGVNSLLVVESRLWIGTDRGVAALDISP